MRNGTQLPRLQANVVLEELSVGQISEHEAGARREARVRTQRLVPGAAVVAGGLEPLSRGKSRFAQR
jgi:hypothetical protein